MNYRHRPRPIVRHTLMLVLMGMLGITLLLVGQGLAIQPGDGQPPTQQSTPVAGDIFPIVPEERPEAITVSQGESRKLTEQPRPTTPTQRRFADTFLANSVRYVTDPQDGLTKDGRVAVLEGFNAQIVYQFSNKLYNAPNEPDLTIYTHDKGGFDGPYNVFVANFGDTTWIPLGSNVVGTSTFDLPAVLSSAELVLLMNQHAGATYIEAIEGVTLGGGGAAPQGIFTYLPDEIIGLRTAHVNCAELDRARTLLTASGQGYPLVPLGELEIKWSVAIQNAWKTEEFFIQAEGEYEVYASNSRGMENLIGRRTGPQGIDLPQDMVDVTAVRVRNPSASRAVILYAIVGRR